MYVYYLVLLLVFAVSVIAYNRGVGLAMYPMGVALMLLVSSEWAW